MKFSINLWTRKIHRWFSIGFCLPLILVICTGLLLQMKKEWYWVQPPTQRGSGTELKLSFNDILRVATTDSQANIKSWDDVERLDVRPDKGMVKLRSVNRWELQIDLGDGQILSSTYRRSDWIESLHDGSWFGEFFKYWIFLPNGVVLLCLWATGLYLWYLPHGAKRKRRKKKAAAKAN